MYQDSCKRVIGSRLLKKCSAYIHIFLLLKNFLREIILANSFMKHVKQHLTSFIQSPDKTHYRVCKNREGPAYRDKLC